MKRLTLFFAIMILGASVMFAQEDSGRKLDTTLSGAVEVPGPGDADGSGTVSVSLNQGKNQVCYELSVMNIGAATAAHIHEAAEGAAGPVVITLTTPGADGKSKGCVDATTDLIKKIRQTPEGFYVNVHTAEFADGAIRGQLAKKPEKPKEPK